MGFLVCSSPKGRPKLVLDAHPGRMSGNLRNSFDALEPPGDNRPQSNIAPYIVICHISYCFGNYIFILSSNF